MYFIKKKKKKASNGTKTTYRPSCLFFSYIKKTPILYRTYMFFKILCIELFSKGRHLNGKLPSAASEAAGLPCCNGTLAGSSSSVFSKIPRSFSAKLLSSQLAPSQKWYMWLFLPRLKFNQEKCKVPHEIPVGTTLQPVKGLNEASK